MNFLNNHSKHGRHKPRHYTAYKSLSELPDPNNTERHEYHCSFVGIIATARAFGRNATQIRVYDGTENDLFKSQENTGISITRGSIEIPSNELVMVTVYNEVWIAFIEEMMRRRNWRNFETGFFNYFTNAMFVEVRCRVKCYNGKFDPVVSSRESGSGLRLLDCPMDLSLYNSTPEISRVLHCLPRDFLLNNQKTFEEAIPRQVLAQIVNVEEGSAAIPATTAPIHTTIRPNQDSSIFAVFNDYPNDDNDDDNSDNDNDDNGDDDNQLPPPSNPRPSTVRSSPLPAVSVPNSTPVHKRTPLSPISSSPKRHRGERLDLAGSSNVVDAKPLNRVAENRQCPIVVTTTGDVTKRIRDLNEIEDFDDRTFAVNAIITAIEPLERQLITKSHVDSVIRFTWLSIELQDTFFEDQAVCDADCLNIIMNTKHELLRFLGIVELEEGYVKANELEQRLLKVINTKKMRVIRVKRSRVKVHDDGLYMIAWEAVGLSLADLENE